MIIFLDSVRWTIKLLSRQIVTSTNWNKLVLEKENRFELKLETNTFKGHHLKIWNQFSNQFQQSCPMQLSCNVCKNQAKSIQTNNQIESIWYKHCQLKWVPSNFHRSNNLSRSPFHLEFILWKAPKKFFLHQPFNIPHLGLILLLDY
jgi:hypothetical protein